MTVSLIQLSVKETAIHKTLKDILCFCEKNLLFSKIPLFFPFCHLKTTLKVSLLYVYLMEQCLGGFYAETSQTLLNNHSVTLAYSTNRNALIIKSLDLHRRIF